MYTRTRAHTPPHTHTYTHTHTDLSDIEFDMKNVEDAINKLDEIFSAGPDGVSGVFLKRTKEDHIEVQVLLQYCLPLGDSNGSREARGNSL